MLGAMSPEREEQENLPLFRLGCALFQDGYLTACLVIQSNSLNNLLLLGYVFIEANSEVKPDANQHCYCSSFNSSVDHRCRYCQGFRISIEFF